MSKNKIPLLRTAKESVSYSKNLVVWNIANFTQRKNLYSKIYSPTFPLCKSDLMWQLAVVPCGWKNDRKEHCFFYGAKLKSNVEVNVRNTYAILNKTGQYMYSAEITRKFVPTHKLFYGNGIIPQNVFNHSKTELWPNDTLTIVVTMRIAAAENINTNPQLIVQYESLLMNENFADVTINIGQRLQIKAHRNILSARCKYFRNILSDNRKTIEIVDNAASIDENIFRLILKYIYNGVLEADDLKYFTQQLFIISGKFELDELHSICETELCESLSLETAPDILLMAHNHSAIYLKNTVKEFIAKHYVYIRLTESWNNLITKHLKLATEVQTK